MSAALRHAFQSGALPTAGDFARRKIVWGELTDESKFAYAGDAVVLNTVFFLAGDEIHHILGVLNSKLIKWYFKRCVGTTSGVGTNRWLKYTLEQIPIVAANPQVGELARRKSDGDDGVTDDDIEAAVCGAYGLDRGERGFVEGY